MFLGVHSPLVSDLLLVWPFAERWWILQCAPNHSAPEKRWQGQKVMFISWHFISFPQCPWSFVYWSCQWSCTYDWIVSSQSKHFFFLCSFICVRNCSVFLACSRSVCLLSPLVWFFWKCCNVYTFSYFCFFADNHVLKFKSTKPGLRELTQQEPTFTLCSITTGQAHECSHLINLMNYWLHTSSSTASLNSH